MLLFSCLQWIILLVVLIKCYNIKKSIIIKSHLPTDTAGYISGYHDQLVIGFLALMTYFILIIQIMMAVLLHNIVGKKRHGLTFIYCDTIFPLNFTNTE